MGIKTCFVLAPVVDPESEVATRLDRMFTNVIAPIAEKLGYQVLRPDMITGPGSVTSQILNHVLQASLIIADLSFPSPNVMYELGVAHAMQRPVIQIASENSTIPFDIRGVRTIVFTLDDIESVRFGQKHLEEFILEIEAEPEPFDSPVIAAAQVQAFNKLKKELTIDGNVPTGTLANILSDLDSRMKAIELLIIRTQKTSSERKEFSRRVFIVHGHDGELKNELARFLERLDFDPIILHEQPDKGQTIFTKLNAEMADVGFAFVILSPDDVGALAARNDQLKGRARQNVVFEHGLFAGHLTPQRVCAIRRGEVEVPSDLHGVLYKTVPEGGSIRSIALELVNELQAAGYIVDANKLLSM